LRHDAARAPRHLERGAAREGEQEDSFRRSALQDEVRDPVRQRVGLLVLALVMMRSGWPGAGGISLLDVQASKAARP
jgi:hypothetical protein